MHYFVKPELVKELGLPTRKVGKPIIMRFVKGRPYETKDLALNVNLNCTTFEFKESFTHCEVNMVDLILEDVFFEIDTVDVRHKSVRLVVCRDGKNDTLKFISLNLVLIDPITNEQMVVVVQMKQLQITHGEARNNGPLLCKKICFFAHLFPFVILSKPCIHFRYNYCIITIIQHLETLLSSRLDIFAPLVITTHPPLTYGIKIVISIDALVEF